MTDAQLTLRIGQHPIWKWVLFLNSGPIVFYRGVWLHCNITDRAPDTTQQRCQNSKYDSSTCERTDLTQIYEWHYSSLHALLLWSFCCLYKIHRWSKHRAVHHIQTKAAPGLSPEPLCSCALLRCISAVTWHAAGCIGNNRVSLVKCRSCRTGCSCTAETGICTVPGGAVRNTWGTPPRDRQKYNKVQLKYGRGETFRNRHSWNLQCVCVFSHLLAYCDKNNLKKRNNTLRRHLSFFFFSFFSFFKSRWEMRMTESFN